MPHTTSHFHVGRGIYFVIFSGFELDEDILWLTGVVLLRGIPAASEILVGAIIRGLFIEPVQAHILRLSHAFMKIDIRSSNLLYHESDPGAEEYGELHGTEAATAVAVAKW